MTNSTGMALPDPRVRWIGRSEANIPRVHQLEESVRGDNKGRALEQGEEDY